MKSRLRESNKPNPKAVSHKYNFSSNGEHINIPCDLQLVVCISICLNATVHDCSSALINGSIQQWRCGRRYLFSMVWCLNWVWKLTWSKRPATWISDLKTTSCKSHGMFIWSPFDEKMYLGETRPWDLAHIFFIKWR